MLSSFEKTKDQLINNHVQLAERPNSRELFQVPAEWWYDRIDFQRVTLGTACSVV